MKKLICIAVICCLGAVFSGCNEIKETNASVSESADENQSENSAEESSEEELSSRDREVNTDTDFVFDDAKILDNGEYDQINTYTAWIAKTFKINAAVVTADDIGDKEPAKYAEDYYNDLYTGDGFLFLVNNDTGDDCIYRKGVPSKFITDSDIQMLFAEISPWIVTGNYVDAIERTLETAELKLPEYITDRSGLLEKEEISELNSQLKDAAGENNLNVFLVSSTGEDSTENYAKKRFGDYYEKDSDSAMIVINTSNGSSYTCTSGSMAYLSDSQKDIQSDIKSCVSENADSEKTFNANEAVTKILSHIQ